MRTAKETYDVRCAWCNVEIDRSEVRNSHGICRDCFNQVISEIKASEHERPKFLEKSSKLTQI